MNNTYWSSAGKYQRNFDELIKLMPMTGKADTVAGELIRAANRLSYDFYNNGMGNNTSGAVNFLNKYGVFDDHQDVFETIHYMSTGRIYDGSYDGDPLQVAIEKSVDLTIERILKDPGLQRDSNHLDMLDFSDPDEYYED